MRSTTSRHSLLFPTALGICLGIFLSNLLTSTNSSQPQIQSPPPDPSYSRLPSPTCGPAPRLHERPPLHYPFCLVLRHATSSSLLFELSPPSPSNNPPNYTVQLTQPSCSGQTVLASSFLQHTRTSPFRFSITSLQPDVDYVAELREHLYPNRPPTLVCRASVSTIPASANLLLNAGFETVADPPYLATRFRRAEDAAPRHWTPFYNGAARRVCGVLPLPQGEFLQPRRGKCCLRLGNSATNWPGGHHPVFHGAHQAVHIPGEVDGVMVSAWYRVEKDLQRWRTSEPESVVDRLAMIVSWRDDDGKDDDGFVVPLQESGEASEQWTRVCAQVRVPKGRRLQMVHVYFHYHDYDGGHVFVDDVSVRPLTGSDAKRLRSCYRDPDMQTARENGKTRKGSDFVRSVPIHLRAEERPTEKQLTLAVPLTSDRALRLEALSRLYGGGPIIATVVVRSEDDASMFRAVWTRKAWLRLHVDVTFVRRRDLPKQEPLEINALRNIAVQAAQTMYVMMADVDMTPATNSFACFHNANTTWLGELLPYGEKRMLTVPVFISDAQHRPAADKEELQNMLRHHAGTSYCLNSQRSNKIKRWYRERDATETRFLTDYEPYGIVRRDEYPAYDERFSGYGFNKISWAYGSEYGGWRIFVLPEAFLTHLNHPENDWVQSIDVPHYLQTWRRFLAFAAEKTGTFGSYGIQNLPLRDTETSDRGRREFD